MGMKRDGIDSYQYYQEDVKMLSEAHFDAYGFSISWSRLLPDGRGKPSEKGVAYYNKLIDALLEKGIKPFVTIFHWDLPQFLEDEYGGFRSDKIVEDFKEYSEHCFRLFGDRVKHWITLNDPYTFTIEGYSTGKHAPGRCSNSFYCPNGEGDLKEPYIVAHNQLRAHVAAVDIYREKYKGHQNGVIGISVFSYWFIPKPTATENDSNEEAVKQSLDHRLGWFLKPLIHGEYPAYYENGLRNSLPEYKPETSTSLFKGKVDFIGLKYYSTKYVKFSTSDKSELTSKIEITDLEEPMGTKVGTFVYYPKGLEELLRYVKSEYNDPFIYITENGFNEIVSSDFKKSIMDTTRTQYHCNHLCFLESAIKNHGSKVKGYFAWSLVDSFSFDDGFKVRFGINYVDYNNVANRQPKFSAQWFKYFLNRNQLIYVFNPSKENISLKL